MIAAVPDDLHVIELSSSNGNLCSEGGSECGSCSGEVGDQIDSSPGFILDTKGSSGLGHENGAAV